MGTIDPAVGLRIDDAAWPRSVRRERPGFDARAVWPPLVLALILTISQWLALGLAMQRGIRSARRVDVAAPIRVELIETPPLVPELPWPEPSASRSRQEARTRHSPRAAAAGPDTTPRAAPRATPRLELFDRDGGVRMPDAGAVEPLRRNAFARPNPLPYRATRFDKAFTPPDESLGEELVRRTTVTHTWRTPWGTEIGCSVSLLLGALGGCGWGEPPRATAEELRAMRADPPPPKHPARDPDLKPGS